jgi:hypothetical protein
VRPVQSPNSLESVWLVIENRAQPGELVTIQSGVEKYALVFTKPESAAVFLADLNDPDLTISSLERWVLKDALLTSAALIGATRVMFDYRSGQHDAVSAPLAGLTEFVRARIGAMPSS